MNKLFISVTLLVSVLFAACGGGKKEEVRLAAIAVKLGGKSANASAHMITASGRVEAENSANISTRMMGYVSKVHVQVGQRVQQGQLLISINNTDLMAKKAQVEAEVLQANAAYTNAKKDYDRFVNLFKDQSASQKELDDMTARFEMAKAGLAGAKEMRNEVQAQFSYANITAPFTGVVTNTFVKAGDMANPGMPLVSVEGASNLQLTAMVAESDISQIKKGMAVKILVKSISKEVAGKVAEVSLSAKNTGGQYLVKINLNEKDPAILSGMFAQVQFPVAASGSVQQAEVLVPLSALVKQGQLTGIYTVGAGNVAILRWLRLGKNFGDQVQVLSGLTADEPYIVWADGKLFNGEKVSIQ